MADASALRDSLQSIAERTQEDMSERDVENLFLEQGFYDALDYEGTGTDLRSEFTLPDTRRPDYITLDTNESRHRSVRVQNDRTRPPTSRVTAVRLHGVLASRIWGAD